MEESVINPNPNPNLNPTRPSGIPRLSRIPTLPSITAQPNAQRPKPPSEKPAQNGKRSSFIPSASADKRRSMLVEPGKLWTAGTVKSIPSAPRDAGALRKPTTGRPSSPIKSKIQPRPTEVASTPSKEDDELGDLDGFRASSRLGYNEHEESNGSETDANGAASTAAKSRKPRLSLSDRTVESLNQVAQSPRPGRRKSSFFEPASPMGPPARPASAMSKGSRPGTSDGTTGAGFQPTTPNRRASMVPRTSMTVPSNKRSVSAAMPQTTPRISKLNLPGKGAATTAPCNPSEDPPTPRTASRSITSGSKTVGARTPKPRTGLGGLFDKTKPSVGAVAGPGQGFVDGAASPDNARKASGSSALREQIAKAKAAARAGTIKPVHGYTTSADNGLDVDAVADPFNLAPKDNKGLLKKRIDSARAEGRLNIAMMGLKEIPEEVLKMYEYDASDPQAANWGEMVDIVKFVAADNELELIADDVFPDVDPASMILDDNNKGPQFGGVEMLDLHGNVLTKVPLGLRRLERLSSLNLSRNKLDRQTFDTITQISTLRELRLADNSLGGPLPPSISKLKQLEVLELQKNKLLSIPDSIRELVHLRVLNISSNRFTTLPMDALNELPLVELVAAKNLLMGMLFPSAVTVSNVQILDVSGNTLAAFSERIQLSMPNLRMLNISNNMIATLPNVSTWTKLISITAEDNKLSYLPPGFTSLKSLKRVDLTGNSLTKLDENLASMDALETLVVAANPLRDKKFLTMSTDEIKRDLQARLTPLSATEPASAEEEEAGVVDGTCREPERADSKPKWTLKPGGILDLSSKKLSQLEPQFESFAAESDVRQIVMHHNDFESIPASLTAAASLTTLDLSHNELTSVNNRVLSFPALRELRLGNNKFRSFDSLIVYVTAPKLQLLDIRNNRFSGSLPNIQSNFSSLTTFLAADNSIAEISAEALEGLKVVDLSNNDIGRLPPEMGRLPITSLNVEGNRFRVPNYQTLQKGTDAVLAWLRDRLPADDGVD